MLNSSGSSCFRIDVVNAKTLYVPGEWIEGTVTLQQFGRLKVRGVRLKWRAKEHTRWKSGDDIYESSFWIFNEQLTLWGAIEVSE